MLLNGTPEDEVNAMYPEIAAQHDSVYAELDKLYVETVENNFDNILPVALASNYYYVESVSEEKRHSSCRPSVYMPIMKKWNISANESNLLKIGRIL
jgi:hypothetical protein